MVVHPHPGRRWCCPSRPMLSDHRYASAIAPDTGAEQHTPCGRPGTSHTSKTIASPAIRSSIRIGDCPDTDAEHHTPCDRPGTSHTSKTIASPAGTSSLQRADSSARSRKHPGTIPERSRNDPGTIPETRAVETTGTAYIRTWCGIRTRSRKRRRDRGPTPHRPRIHKTQQPPDAVKRRGLRLSTSKILTGTSASPSWTGSARGTSRGRRRHR
jgi:hypothetical protein